MIRGRVRIVLWPDRTKQDDHVFALILDGVHATHDEHSPIVQGDDVTLSFHRNDDNHIEDGRAV